MKTYLVVDRPETWPLHVEGVEVVQARAYLTDETYFSARARVFNLCRSYRYQRTGYYVSLLAEARGHKPTPDIGTIRDLSHRGILRLVSEDLDKSIQDSLGKLKGDRFTLSIYFGRNLARQHDELARKLFSHFRAPLLRAQFRKEADEDGKEGLWELQNIYPIAISQVPDTHRDFVLEAAKNFFSGRIKPRTRKPPRYHMAILADKADPMPPSNAEALNRFIKAAEKLDFQADLITKDDLFQLSTYDALFIRETTYVNNHTYRFARQAEKDGLVVIDDPTSILRCTNKVYLLELLRHNRLPAPRAMVVHKHNLREVRETIGFPCILKAPDSSFSHGVEKAESEEELREIADRMLGTSELLVGQEYMRTDFDWRVGILNGEPLFVCKYFMAGKHWQIYDHAAQGDDVTGDVQTLRVEDAPVKVVQTALRAANLIGKGLYGVDLKEVGGKPYVIEVNDNPSIDAGCEDLVLGQFLYDRIMEHFNARLNERTLRSRP